VSANNTQQAQAGSSAMANADNTTHLKSDASNSNDVKSTNNTTQGASSTQTNKAMVFNDLSTFNSHNLMVTVNLTASQAQTVIQLFQGSNNTLDNFASFPIATPACVPAIDPVLSQPTIVSPTIVTPANVNREGVRLAAAPSVKEVAKPE
jgi:hypothetical protein